MWVELLPFIFFLWFFNFSFYVNLISIYFHLGSNLRYLIGTTYKTEDSFTQTMMPTPGPGDPHPSLLCLHLLGSDWLIQSNQVKLFRMETMT